MALLAHLFTIQRYVLQFKWMRMKSRHTAAITCGSQKDWSKHVFFWCAKDKKVLWFAIFIDQVVKSRLYVECKGWPGGQVSHVFENCAENHATLLGQLLLAKQWPANDDHDDDDSSNDNLVTLGNMGIW